MEATGKVRAENLVNLCYADLSESDISVLQQAENDINKDRAEKKVFLMALKE